MNNPTKAVLEKDKNLTPMAKRKNIPAVRTYTGHSKRMSTIMAELLIYDMFPRKYQRNASIDKIE